MRKTFFSKAAEYLAQKRRRRIWAKVVGVLACVVVFCTTYALILPAITLEYGAEDSNGNSAVHTHTEDCYDADGNLICGQTDAAGESMASAAGSATAETASATIDASWGAGALQEGAVLAVSEYAKADTRYNELGQAISAKLAESGAINAIYPFEIHFVDGNGNKVEPSGEVTVTVNFREPVRENGDNPANWKVFHVADDGAIEELTDVSIDKSEANGERAVNGFTYQSASFSDFVLADTAAADVTDVPVAGESNGKQYAIIHIGAKAALTTVEKQVDSINGLNAKNLDGLLLSSGQDYNVFAGEDSGTVSSEILVWSFEPIGDSPATPDAGQDGQYYITTTDANGDKKYLTITAIGDMERANVILEDNPTENSVITLTPGEGDFYGEFRLTNSEGYALNLYGGEVERGFAGWRNSSGQTDDSNEWLYLRDSVKNLDQNVVNNAKTVKGVSPVGTVINMFDYWTVNRDISDKSDNWDWYKDVEQNIDKSTAEMGINKEHTLKFLGNNRPEGEDFNDWTGSAAPNYGIVKNQLVDGYPSLDESKVGSGKAESLTYLFDPNTENLYRKTFRNVGGLLQIDPTGYYYYNSQKNFAELDEETNQITLYDHWGVVSSASSPDGQFFPFNEYRGEHGVALSDSRNAEDGKEINHYFGMTLTTRFVQKYNGHTDATEKTATTFEFAGDDDVWIFVDDVLVADLGGIHDRASVKINFATGTVTINDGMSADVQSVTTLREAFAAAGKGSDPTLKEGTDTFTDNSYHTLKFYYLERGNYDSNLDLKYNLTEIPATSIFKVNQYGEPVEGAVFAVYQSDENWNYTVEGEETVLGDFKYRFDTEEADEGNPYDIITEGTKIVPELYHGTTDAKGEMVFVDEDNMPYTLNDLQNKFGQYFILREVYVPDGYRLVDDDIHLYIDRNILRCENKYDSGVCASPNLLVTATNELRLSNTYNGKDNVEYYNADSTDNPINGTLFAVVLKYLGNDNESDLTNGSLWKPVYGNDMKGYVVVDDVADPVGAAIKAAQTQKQEKYGDVEFALSASGAMQLNMTNLPGDIDTYYYMLDADSKANTKYTVAYYWTDGTLENATAENTRRVLADKDEIYNGFDRTFGSTIEVPNLVNRLFVQKFDTDGTNRVNGAKFALYKVSEEENQIYYIANDSTKVLLEQGEKANVGDSEGAYSVDPVTGVITVTIGETTSYTISPAVDANGSPLLTETCSSDENGVGEDGTGSFDNLLKGTYYMREVDAPKGYDINPTEVMVLVTDNAIYANAGTEEDNVTVARGPGYVVSTLHQFASDGDIDKTLTWIYTKLKVNTTDQNTFNIYKSSNWTEDPKNITYLKYGNEESNKVFNYDVNAGVDDGKGTRRLYTDEGWSYLGIYQDTKRPDNEELGDAVYDRAIEGEDISGLFSRSVYIQVTDSRTVGSLEISKKVENAPEGKSFTFTVELKDADGNGLNECSYTIYTLNAEGEYGDTVNNYGVISNGGTIQLFANQIAVIEGLPPETQYTVTESRNQDYSTVAVKDKGETDTEIYDDDMIDDVCVTGELDWSISGGELDNTSTVEYTNTYLPDFTIVKVDNTNPEITLQGAEFVLYYTVKDENTGTETKYYYTPNGWVTTENAAAKLTSGADGRILLSNIPDNTYYLVEKTAPAGYNLLANAVTISVQNGKVQSATAGTANYEIKDDGTALKIPNSTGITLPNTGGSGARRYMVIGLLLMCSAVCCMYITKMRGREDIKNIL